MIYSCSECGGQLRVDEDRGDEVFLAPCILCKTELAAHAYDTGWHDGHELGLGEKKVN